MSCRVLNCRNRGKPTATVSFYAFPKNPALRYSWKAATGFEKMDLKSPNLAICQEHFRDSDFMPMEQTIKGRSRQLRYGALPTENLPENAYSNFPEHLPATIEHESGNDSITTQYAARIQELEKEVQEQAAKLAILKNIFTTEQLQRLFMSTPRTQYISKDEAERAVRNHESQPPSHPGSSKRQSGDGEEERSAPGAGGQGRPKVVETFNDFTEVENEAAIDRYLIKSKLLVTKLKTT